MYRGCAAEVASGETCNSCGRKHAYLITFKRVMLCAGVLIVLTAVWLYATDSGSQFRRYW